jgi:hypothetical protein
MLKTIKSNLPYSVKVFLRSRLGSIAYSNESYSQEGEDLLISRIFNKGGAGVYVDVGAHHAFRFSNTYLFYKKGWHGVNVDAAPGSMISFHKNRKRDINIEIGISSFPKNANFFVFKEPALNTFDENLAQQRMNMGYELHHKIQVRSERLSKVLDGCRMKIDLGNSFFSIDVEGRDLDVLESNDWKKYRPSFIIIEIIAKNFNDVLSHSASKFLSGNGYEIYAKLGASVVFKHCEYEMFQ